MGYGKGEDKPEHQTNHRNGASGKRILTDQGSLEIEIPRDRESKEVVEFYRCIYDER